MKSRNVLQYNCPHFICWYPVKFNINFCGFVGQILHIIKYEGWNFNFGNAAVTFDTAHIQSSYFHRPSMYSPKLCRKRSQR